MEYLLFRLYGPLASWGDPAVGSDRPSALRPSRSALLGLLAAALGIKREQQEMLDELGASVTFAIKQYSAGTLVRDFHTAQVPSHDKKRALKMRKDELSSEKLNTVLSSRDYRCDGLWVVAVKLTQDTKYSLGQLQQALIKPKFMLYLGRKSCPLAAPLEPLIVQQDSLRRALDTEFKPMLSETTKLDAIWLPKSKRATYYWHDSDDSVEFVGVSSSTVWDEPVHRARWQFANRVEHSASTDEREG